MTQALVPRCRYVLQSPCTCFPARSRRWASRWFCQGRVQMKLSEATSSFTKRQMLQSTTSKNQEGTTAFTQHLFLMAHVLLILGAKTFEKRTGWPVYWYNLKAWIYGLKPITLYVRSIFYQGIILEEYVFVLWYLTCVWSERYDVANMGAEQKHAKALGSCLLSYLILTPVINVLVSLGNRWDWAIEIGKYARFLYGRLCKSQFWLQHREANAHNFVIIALLWNAGIYLWCRM